VNFLKKSSKKGERILMDDAIMHRDAKFLMPFADQIKQAGEFDSVIIIATKRYDDAEGGVTAKIDAQCGNHYAVNWSVYEYIVEQKENIKNIGEEE
jgi:hypothetical protein